MGDFLLGMVWRVGTEVITPLFLSGAEQDRCELRVPSVRGVLRFWLRAALGGHLGLDVLRRLEGDVWGSTAKASPFVVRLENMTVNEGETAELDGRRIPRVSRMAPAGARYLAYSALLRERDQFKRPRYIAEGSGFDLVVEPRVGVKEELVRAHGELVKANLWLFCQFGSLGLRSRRGLGALRARGDLDGWGLQPGGTPQEHARLLSVGLKKMESVVRGYAGGARAPPPASFPVLAQSQCSVRVYEGTNRSWVGLLDEIGSVYQGYRRTLSLGDRTALGGPIVARRERLGERFASPFFIRPVRLGGGGYGAVLLAFRSGLDERRYEPVRGALERFRGHDVLR